MQPALASASELANLLDQYMAELQAGRRPDRARIVAEHPGLAPQLEEALASLEFVHGAESETGKPPAQLGDFRIVREVGRGGMGVVYEAEQVSLKRRVALKVLRFGAAVDEVALQRFQREAETVARLHHTNIVPIFAVGIDQGVRYYAMEFIEGCDLAELAQRARADAQCLQPQVVAKWGLQAAEALAHAHERGVIHRDIKPSNLILDAGNRIWLTDFGLARRLDDVTLSLTGALLGTPRYMSPEQASAATKPVDHRTDIYSLGATLYELVTKAPIFDAGSPHELIRLILQEEPIGPRRLVPTLPRDLETIILKCVSKEAGERYPSAQALADDLRAFLEGRAIKARRASVREQGLRWARKHRRSTTVAAFSAGVSLVLAVGGFLFGQDRQQARLGRLTLTTDTPNLLAEVVDAAGRSLAPAFPVPTPQPVALRAGAHQLRLSASGLLSEDWPIEITRRQAETRSVQLRPRWLWPPGEVNTADDAETQVVTLGSHADLLVLAHARAAAGSPDTVRRLRRLDGATGRPVWPSDLVFDETTLPSGRSLAEWKDLLRPANLGWGRSDALLADRAGDLDGDGVGDLVLLCRGAPSLLAVSGATGRVLWWACVRPDLDPAAGGTDHPTTGLKLDRIGGGFAVGAPAVSDVDADGTPDFVACFHSDGDSYVGLGDARVRTGARSLLGAVSGKTGAVLWQVGIDENWSQYLNSSTVAEKYEPLCRPAVARVNGHPVVVLVEKSQLRGFDAHTGKPAWPSLPLGFEPDSAPDVTDLDGDGQSEVVFLRVRESTGSAPLAVARTGEREFREETSLNLLALALPDGVARWEKPILVVPRHQAQELKNRRRQFHRVADLDGDGRPEAILSGGLRTLTGGNRMGFEVLDGKSGTNRWRRLVWAEHFFGGAWNVDQFTVGPDLDGDGNRELFAAWEGYDERSRKHGLFVAALSGATGAMLWQVHEPAVGATSTLAWWHAGADGWPLLLVSASRAVGRQGITLVLAAGSGKVEHTLLDVLRPRVADFDGDGILDLFYTVAPQGTLRNLVLKGVAPDAWRQLGDWQAASDFDGDGFTDLVGIANGVLSARSGGDGRLLWQARKGPRDSPMEWPVPAGDLDGDGVPDVLATVQPWRETQPRVYASRRLPAAFSGKDGRQLWTGEQIEVLGGNASGSMGGWSYCYPDLGLADLDRDGRAEVLAVGGQSSGALQLFAASGRDGRLLWTAPVTRGSHAAKPSPAGLPLGDFDQDQVLDLAVWMPASPGNSTSGPQRLNAVSGRTGQPLWSAPAVAVSHPDRLIWPGATVADLDNDGNPQVLVTRHGGFEPRTGQYPCEVVAVDGREGTVRWTWAWQGGFPDMWPPVVLRSPGAGQPLVCLAIQTNGISTLVALESGGRERVRRRLNTASLQLGFGAFVWRAADVNGDGRDELLYLDDGKLCAAGGDALEVRWQWPLPNNAVQVVDVRATAPGLPPTVTVWSGPEIHGIDGASGTPLWRCGVTGQPHQGGSETPAVRLLTAPPPALPRLQYLSSTRRASGAASVARQAWPVEATGRYLAPKPAPRSYLPIKEFRAPKRLLPWAQDNDAAVVFSGALTMLTAGIPVVLVLWAVRRQAWLAGLLPVGYAGLSLLLPWRALVPAVAVLGYTVWLGVRARRSGQRLVLLAALAYAVLAAIVLLGSLTPGAAGNDPTWLRALQMTVVGAPGLGFWVLCGWAIRKRRWRTLGWLVGASILAALLAAAFSLWDDLRYRATDESYSMKGACFIWFVGTTLAGLAGLLSLGGQHVVSWIRRSRAGRTAEA
jgi:tRNA A-37 threonylcarbamoyl transferase component Bud32